MYLFSRKRNRTFNFFDGHFDLEVTYADDYSKLAFLFCPKSHDVWRDSIRKRRVIKATGLDFDLHPVTRNRS